MASLEPIHRITGAGGLRLAVHEYGQPAGKPIVLIHGINQCSLVWEQQYRSVLAEEFRLVCPDLRGHGMSDKPTDPEYYNQATLWADDVQAVLKALSLRKPILAGWSYGGYVINDYLAKYGQDAIGGLNYVCAGVVMGGANTTQLLGRDFINTIPGLCSDNLEDNIQAVRKLIRVLFERQPSQEEIEIQVAYSMVVPPTARLGMFSRTIDCDAVMKKLTIPVLITRGEKDRVVTLAHTELLLAAIPLAKISVFEGAGHSPHLEDAERFNRELGQFARQYAG
ncbi:MAG TPA: alpha/beta hydrolase [Nitrospira sp.]|nr:alpha/beta hydrolase [Nitrospira sp.]